MRRCSCKHKYSKANPLQLRDRDAPLFSTYTAIIRVVVVTLQLPLALLVLQRVLPDLPSPRPQYLDHLGRDGGRQGHADKDEALVDGVCQGELGCEACRLIS